MQDTKADNYLYQDNLVEDELNDKFYNHKLRCKDLSDSYNRLGMIERSKKVLDCGSVLEFKIYSNNNCKPTLASANFCKDRLCPMCAWRRSLKIFGQVSQIMDVIEKDYSFIFMTLTIKNCPGILLSKHIDILQKGFKTLMQNKRIKTAFKGVFKALEVTRHPYYLDKNLEYHPHLHCIVAVNKSYFKSRDYIKQAELINIWKNAIKVDYDPNVDIRKVQSKNDFGDISIKSAVAEAAKYTVKSNDYLNFHDNNIIDEGVKTISEALGKRRLCSFSGIFRDTKAKLNLDDDIDGDLVHVGDDVRDDVNYVIVKYKWFVGCGYILTYTTEITEIKE